MASQPHPFEEPAPQITAPDFGPTITILFSDIRGFTAFTERYGDQATVAMLRRHNQLLREQIDVSQGQVIKTEGDSFMVVFPSARRAIFCAAAMQRAIQEANRSQQGPEIQIGIGLSAGEPIQEEGDLFGAAVNLAARVTAKAQGGQILASELVRGLAGTLPGMGYQDAGRHDLKGLQGKHHLYEVLWSQEQLERLPPTVITRAFRSWTFWAIAMLVTLTFGSLTLWLWWGAPKIQDMLVEGVQQKFLSEVPMASVLVQENFVDNRRGWILSSGTRYLEGEALHLVVPRERPNISSWPETGPTRFNNFILQVEATVLDGPTSGSYGIVFRNQGPTNFYLFEISVDGRYHLFRMANGALEQLIPWKRSQTIRRGYKMNELAIFAAGPAIRIYANGRQLDELTDETFSEGEIQVYAAGSGLHVAFDNLKITELPETG